MTRLLPALARRSDLDAETLASFGSLWDKLSDAGGEGIETKQAAEGDAAGLVPPSLASVQSSAGPPAAPRSSRPPPRDDPR